MLNPAYTKTIVFSTLLVFVIGVFLRLYPSAGTQGIGFDEKLYAKYVNVLSKTGLKNYPATCEAYIEAQQELPSAILPPTRFLYIYSAYLWQSAFGGDSLIALHRISCLFSMLTLALSMFFAARVGGPAVIMGVTALMACAPTQIHMSQHALIDGFFAFWALLSVWTLWENLQSPNRIGWLLFYGISLGLMVLAKENAAFVFAAILLLLLLNRWMQFGRVTPALLATTLIGPAAGFVLLNILAGGPAHFIRIYELLIQKAYALEYAIRFCDGPWYRYLVDLLLVSPLVFLLAVGEVFQITRAKKAALYFTLFIAGSYLCMANVKYSYNLRYANMWDLPLRYLAFAQLTTLSTSWGRYRVPLLVGIVLLLCLFELNQYRIFFVDYRLYELVSEGLLRAVRIIK